MVENIQRRKRLSNEYIAGLVKEVEFKEKMHLLNKKGA